MKPDFISLVSYLDSSELEILKAKLQRSKIPCLTNEHGPNTGTGQNFYFEIKVNPRHYTQAKRVVEEFKLQASKNQRCPNCRSSSWETISNPTILQKIIYIGTTPIRCKKCKTIYVK